MGTAKITDSVTGIFAVTTIKNVQGVLIPRRILVTLNNFFTMYLQLCTSKWHTFRALIILTIIFRLLQETLLLRNTSYFVS